MHGNATILVNVMSHMFQHIYSGERVQTNLVTNLPGEDRRYYITNANGLESIAYPDELKFDTDYTYTLVKWRGGVLVKADTFQEFIENLNQYTIDNLGDDPDRFWDSFWGGDLDIYLTNEANMYDIVSPSDFMIATYLATEGYDEHDLIYPSWVRPGAMGIKLDNEDESVKSAYEFIQNNLGYES